MGWGVKVAILDSGCPPGFQPHKSKDFFGGGIVDCRNHGIFVTTIINHYAAGALIYIANIGSYKPSEIALLKALEWAADEGVDLINISSGFGPQKCKGNCVLANLIDAISSQTHTVIVTAAGNSGPNINTINCPSCAKLAVSVGAISSQGSLADYSSRGKIGGAKPDILAPGEVCLNTMCDSGTSFAAPVITGILAATLKYSSGKGAVQRLYDTAKTLGLNRHEEGYGAVNIDRYLEVITHGRSDGASEGQK